MSDGRERDGRDEPNGRDGRDGRDADARAHARIEGALRQLGAELTAPAGWQERVLAAIAAEERAQAVAERAAAAPAETKAEPVQAAAAAAIASGPGAVAAKAPPSASEPGPVRRRGRWWAFAAPGVAVAALAAVVLLRLLPATAPDGTPQSVEVIASSGERVRGSTAGVRWQARVGDTLIGRATGEGRYRAVWIFRNERELVAACTAPGCPGGDGAIAARHVVQRVGTYTVVRLAANEPLPPPVSTSLDRSIAAAMSADAKIEQDEITVE